MNILMGHEAQPEGDGVTVVVRKIAKKAVEYGDKSIVVTGWVQHQELSPVPLYFVPAIRFPLYREYRMPYQTRFDENLVKKLDAFDPDVIHLHSPGPFFARAIIAYARQKGIPIIGTYHTDFDKYLRYYHLSLLRPLLWFLLRGVYNNVDAVTTPSQATAESLIYHGVKNVHVIPWGTDLKGFNPSYRSAQWRAKILTGEQKKIMLFVGRLTWEKDLKTLAKVWNILRGTRNDVVMVIAGDGPNRKDLEKLMPKAQFLGRINKEDLAIAYASSDILLFPSSTETFGNVTIEAMASGIVPVVANEGGSKTLVKDGETGFLCRTRDAKDFAQKTQQLLDDENLYARMRSACITYAQDFSWERVYEHIRDIYTSVIQEEVPAYEEELLSQG